MVKKCLILVLLAQISTGLASTCPMPLDVVHKRSWYPPTGWNEAYHNKQPKTPYTFANASIYNRGDHYAVYCYYNGNFKKKDKFSSFVIIREYPLDSVDVTGQGWKTIYHEMHQCGTPDVTDKEYPSLPKDCAW